MDLVPTEQFPSETNDDRPIQYGMPLWRDLFSRRQLYCHATSVEVFRELLEAEQAKGGLTETSKAAFGYLAVSLDKLLNYNSRMSVWMSTREVVANTFNRHDFSFAWSHAEMAPLIVALGYDWAIEQTAKCIGEAASTSTSPASARPWRSSLATGR
jgi:putative DNA methylase